MSRPVLPRTREAQVWDAVVKKLSAAQSRKFEASEGTPYVQWVPGMRVQGIYLGELPNGYADHVAGFTVRNGVVPPDAEYVLTPDGTLLHFVGWIEVRAANGRLKKIIRHHNEKFVRELKSVPVGVSVTIEYLDEVQGFRVQRNVRTRRRTKQRR